MLQDKEIKIALTVGELTMIQDALEKVRALEEFERWLRGHWKHGESEFIKTDDVWEMYWECQAD